MPEIDIETAIIGAGQAGVRLARALAADGRGVALGIRVRQVEVDSPAVMDRARRPATRDPSLCNQSTDENLFASRPELTNRPSGTHKAVAGRSCC